VNTADLKEFVALEQRKAGLKAELATVQERLTELNESLTQQFADDGMTKTTIDGRTVYVRNTLRVYPLPDQRANAVEALKACGLGMYVREDFNTQSVEAVLRDLIQQAEAQAEENGQVLSDYSAALPPELAGVMKVAPVSTIVSVKVPQPKR
jgi:hypothetical protein